MPLLSCFCGASGPPPPIVKSAPQKGAKDLDTAVSILPLGNEELFQLSHLLSTLEEGWWSALHEACRAICKVLSADHACIDVVNPSDGWAATAACAGLGADLAAGRVCSCDPRYNASVAAALLREHKPPQPYVLLFRDAASGVGSAAGASSDKLSSCSAALADSLPADWSVLRDAEGCTQFAAVGCVAPGGSLLGVLSIAGRGPSRPAPWRPESLHCAVRLLSGHIRRAAQVLASPPVSAMAAAASFSELVAAAAEVAADVSEAAGHVRGQIRVAFVRADLGTAAVFQQPAPASHPSRAGPGEAADTAAANVARVRLLGPRRSSCEFVLSNSSRAGRGSSLGAASLPGQEALAAARASGVEASGGSSTAGERTLWDSPGPSGMTAKLMSFTLQAGKGITCRGHTLSLGRTLLDEALGKGMAGLCIDDCQAYTVGAKAYPRDLVLTRGSLLPTSLALATVPHPDSGEPLLAVYVTYDTMLPKQLLAAVVAEMEQLLRAITPLVLSKLEGDLEAEYEYLVRQLEEASSGKALLRKAASEAPNAQPKPRRQTATVGAAAVEGGAGAKGAGRPAAATESSTSASASSSGGCGGAAATSTTPSERTTSGIVPPESSEASAGEAAEVGSAAAAAAAGGGGGPLHQASSKLGVVAEGGALLPRRIRSLRRGNVRAQSAGQAGEAPNARLLSALGMRSVSFRLEAAQSPRGASKLAPLIASMHERLKAAQAAALTDHSGGRKDDVQSLKLVQEIGRGGYGTVYRGTYHEAEVAVKFISQSRLASGPNGQGQGRGGSSASACLGLHKQHLHDAIELVASVSMSHTNIVQVPAYFLDVRLLKPADAANPLDSMDAPTESRPFALAHIGSTLNSSAMGLDTNGHTEAVGMALVLEYCDCGSLCDAITNRQFIERVAPKAAPALSSAPPKAYLAINMRSVYLTLLEISLALRHMHGLALVHCDLKPQNVLLKSSPRDPRGFTAKLSDFGLAKMMAHDERGQLVIDEAVASGTITHVAPEVLLGEESVGAAVDIYAFGILMYQILCGMSVYDKSMTATHIANEVAYSGMRPRLPAWVPASYRSLAESCWHESPASRPTADDLVRHLESALEARRAASGASSSAAAALAARGR